jgi:ribosomal protein S18 acetylase RimI-like enzyme
VVAPDLNPAFDPTLLSRIEDAGLNASAPPQQRWLDGWLLRFSPGKAKRARCINAVAVGRGPLDERLAASAVAFGDVGLPLIFRITPFSEPAGLDALLAARGLRRFDDTRVMVLADLAGPRAPADAPDAAAAATAGTVLRPVDAEALAQRIGAWRGSSAAVCEAHAQRLRQSPVPYSAFELIHRDAVVACGQIATEGDLVGLYDVFTAEAERGRGWATELCRRLLVSAKERGARHAYLQVDGDNAAARGVYHRLGFRDAYAYHYRSADPAAA